MRQWHIVNYNKSKLCYDRRSVGQSVLVSSTHLEPKTRFLLLLYSCGFVDVGCPLWRENRSVFYNCCWATPAQPFSGPSSAGPITVFYCLRFEIPPTWRARSPYLYPQGTGCPRTGFPFRPPRRATVEVFKPASMRGIIMPLVRVRVRVRVTLRLAVYRQSVRLGAKPLKTHDQIFLFNFILAFIILV
jgi:hypothetical protein